MEREIDRQKTAMKVSWITIAANFVLSVFKLAAGIIAKSGAMVSDAVHSASDVLSTFVVMAGVKISGKKADDSHPYGHERMECVASMFLAVILAVTGIGIGISGINKITGGGELTVPGVLALVAAAISIMVKELMFWYTRHYAKKLNSGALMADAWHHRSDALSSVGSLIGIGGALLGVPILDPIASVVICLFILCSGIVRGFAADLPVLYITTPDGSAITSKEEWREGCRLRIVLPDGTTAYDSDKAALKGRGHSTFTKPKKPFAIKLDEKSGLLGMEKGKRWVLLANFMDHSLLRNKLAFSIARQTSLAWTPDSRFVDVVVNGKPQGCYLLCEQIRVNENRVNIDEEEGYLLEADAYLDEKNHFYTPRRHLPVNMKEPGTAQQLPYIQRYFQEIEDLLYGRGNDLTKLYEKYIDLESFVDWWLVHELTQNAEPNGPRSCYMYKDKDSLLKAGPVWDFDLAFISVGVDAGGDLRPSRLNRKDVRLLTTDSLYNRDSRRVQRARVQLPAHRRSRHLPDVIA